MIKLGKIQELEIKRFASQGAYLNEENPQEDDILLPKKEVPEKSNIGDKLEVMIYKDSKDRLIATTRKPLARVGELSHLMVVSKTKIGSFLDWGLEKDLFLPFSETIGSVEVGKTYLVGVYIDKSRRLAATMRIKDMLSNDSPFEVNEKTQGTIYSIHRDIGAFVAVEDKYDGLIPKRELYGAHDVGSEVDVRVARILDDGKLELSLRAQAYKQMDKDSETIMFKMKDNKGKLNLNDKSSPEEIYQELEMSKAGFKRAIGKLYKEGIITFTDKGIRFK